MNDSYAIPVHIMLPLIGLLNQCSKGVPVMQEKNAEMEQELLIAQKCSHDNMDKLQDVEKNYVHLRDNLKK